MMQKTIVFVGTLLLFWGCVQKEQKIPKQEVSRRPNILFIMSDDHAYQAISAYGSELSKLAPTPNIDRIAKEGAIFNRAYVTNSICGPSRAVILTGKHSHINGFRANGDRFDGSQPTLPKYMKKLGYQTAIVGKWHLYGWPQGFDYWNIVQDQGHYYNPDFIKNGDSITIPGYVTDIITDDALNWLKNRNDTVPFFLMLHHKAPHRNWMPPLRYTNKYDSVKFPIPDTYFDQHKNQLAAQQQLMTVYKDMYEGYDLKLTKKLGSPELASNPWPTDFERMSREQRKIWDKGYQFKNDAFHRADLHGKALDNYKEERYLQDYMATVAAVDEGVGKVLDYLKDNNLEDNTIVVYTSDQGFYLGEKGWFDKRFMYEESYRTPLLIRYPMEIKKGTQINALVQNLDYAQTLLDFAGGGQYTHEMQGESLRPLLNQTMDEDDFRDVLYYHYYAYPAFHMVKKHYGISTKRYKLMHFYDDIDAWEFYDLEKDPKELHNAIDDPGYKDIIANMHMRLDTVQKYYKVTSKEFKKSPEKNVERAYKVFEKLRGTPMR
ncbi:sulfatase [Flavobacteriaceae bacterium F89]|uniref:Sulfatase n=1 Tax=Cerina litoralis TaxID=2874477 RepID=A0AAE3ERX9_9FLAO|nr:sulfatase [Cerina litoralis]MCG2460107.1 sulfatase [Cerina litoralis]